MTSSQISQSLSFAPNGLTLAKFRFYAPNDPMAVADHSNFVTLTIPVLAGTTYGTIPTAETSIWNTLAVQGSPGNWSLASNAGPNPFSGQNGQFNIYNVPVTSDGTTGWYQLVFGDSSHQTVYNIYANNTGGVFQPISGAGANATNFVVDHGLALQQTLNGAHQYVYYTMNFAPSGVMTYDINTFSAPSTIFDKPGDQTAVSPLPSAGFTLSVNAGGSMITAVVKAGTVGTDTLTSIDTIKFADKAIDAASITKTASLPADQILKVVDLYTAVLNRAPDALGLDYWASRLANGASLSDISKAIFGSAEAAPLYSSTDPTSTFVTKVYATTLGRAPDAAGSAFWINELQAGNLQRTDFVTALIAGARGPGGSAADAQYIANKEAVGAHFALTQGLSNPIEARLVESGINATAASVTAANAQTDSFATIAATTATAELVVQILGIVP